MRTLTKRDMTEREGTSRNKRARRDSSKMLRGGSIKLESKFGANTIAEQPASRLLAGVLFFHSLLGAEAA